MALIRAHKFIEKYQDAGITPGGFRYELFQSATNGLEADGVVIREGRKVWIDEDAYWARKLRNSKAAGRLSVSLWHATA